MTIYQKLGILIYIVLIIQGTANITVLYMKAKKTRVFYSLLACHMAMLLWLFFAIIEMFSVGKPFFNIAVRLTLIPIMLIGALFLIFALYYAGLINIKNKSVTSILLLPSIICYLPLMSEGSSYLVIREMIKDTKVIEWGVVFLFNTILAHIYILTGGIIILYKAFKKSYQLKQNIILCLSLSVPGVLNILQGTGIIKTVGFDYVPVSFSIILATLSVLIFKYQIINIVPIASYKLFNYINSAALIVDSDGNIDDFNNTFEEYFRQLLSSRPCEDVYSLIAYLDKQSDDKKTINKLIEILNTKDEQAYEVTIRTGAGNSDSRQYTISIVPINLSAGRTVGKLIIIKDVTEYRSSTLNEERSRLSNDLHDSLGNCINIISSNLEYALKNITGHPEVRECLEVSYNKTTSAFLHLRRIVEELKPIDIENNGLIWALQSLFYKLSMKGLHIDFTHKNVDDKLLSTRKHGEVIYFICQEAINNAVIHGKAANITIIINQVQGMLRLYISDDGIGCNRIVKSKGLNSMECRIRELAGSLEYGSPSEGGFNLRAVIPLNNISVIDNT